jgi:phospholipid-transporting ATPase
MSVIVQNVKTKKYWLLTKGADNVIEKRTANTRSFKMSELQEALSSYSKQGLRTMVLAYREILEEEFFTLSKKIGNTENMTPYRRQEELNTIYENVESKLVVVGATAVEDELQEKVSQTIQAFVERGVKVWMLTGDKLETATNIAYSSQIINDKDKLLIVNKVEDFLEKEMIEELLGHSIRKGSQMDINLYEEGRIAMAISGEILWVIFNEPDYKKNFIKFLENVDIVIAARVTPGQKAEIVKLVKEHVEGAKTLAIGDGANDVNMIISSDVGVAIYGKEGRQANRVADFSISEFKHLGPLVIHYGADMYKRNSTYALYNFYKNYLVLFPSI